MQPVRPVVVPYTYTEHAAMPSDGRRWELNGRPATGSSDRARGAAAPGERARYRGPPDLVVEILSPSTQVLDRRVKPRTYARFGVPEYWVVDGELGAVELYRLGTEGFGLEMRFDCASSLTTPSFPELAVDLARAFRR
jgi:Uma2 family endonuclease